jgi:hypothetical protein
MLDPAQCNVDQDQDGLSGFPEHHINLVASGAGSRVITDAEPVQLIDAECTLLMQVDPSMLDEPGWQYL